MSEKKPRDTVVIACHCYSSDAEEFKRLCREDGKFHSEVLRNFIVGYINEKTKEGKAEEEEEDWEKDDEPPFVEKKRRIL